MTTEVRNRPQRIDNIVNYILDMTKKDAVYKRIVDTYLHDIYSNSEARGPVNIKAVVESNLIEIMFLAMSTKTKQVDDFYKKLVKDQIYRGVRIKLESGEIPDEVFKILNGK